MNAINFDDHYAGANGLSYVSEVKSGRIKAYIDDVRRKEYKDFHVHPEGQTRFYIVKYLEPVLGNEKALGLKRSCHLAKKSFATLCKMHR